MGAKSGLALKGLQWFIRGVQFCCAAVVLALYSYFMASLSNRNLPIANWIKAVEGISGIAVLYTIAGLLLLWCFAGRRVTSFLAMVLDVAFIGGFIFIAWANRGGANSCNGIVSTPYGTADADTNIQPNGDTGYTGLPSFRQACRLQTACFAVSLIAIFFFIFSAIVEVSLVRNRQKEKRFGPSPKNNYTSGSGTGKRFGFLGRRNKSVRSQNTNVLPQHTHPDAVRDSYATESTAVSGGAAGVPPQSTHAKYGEVGYGNQRTGVVEPAQYPEANYQRY